MATATALTPEQKEAEIFAEFDISLPFKESQEKINEHMVREFYGEDAIKALKEHGVFYPNMKQFFKQVSANEYQYYPENEKAYTVSEGVPTNPKWKSRMQFGIFDRKRNGRHADMEE